MDNAIALKFQKNVNDGSKKMEIHFHVEYVCLVGRAGDGVIRGFLFVQSSLGKSSASLRSSVRKALDTGSSCNKSPSVYRKKTGNSRKASDLKGWKKPTEDPSRFSTYLIVE